MTAWDLPVALTVAGEEYQIRTDFRVILDIMAALNDPDLFEKDADEEERKRVSMLTILQILYIDFETIPTENYNEALERAVDFIDMGIRDNGKRKPHTMDWEQDAQIIIPAINRVQGREIRELKYLHWWTFLGSYMEIGECLFAQVVHIRQKKQQHQKLEKWEREFYNANKDIIDIRKKVSTEQKKEMENLGKWL